MESSQQTEFMHLDVLIPGLFDGLANWPSNQNQGKQSTALGWLLSHGNFSRQDAIGFEVSLWRCFDPELKQGDELPVAALRTNCSDTPSICSDPVHLQIGVTEVELLSGPDLMLSQTESDEIVTLLSDYFKEEGFRFMLDENGLGILLLNKKANIKTTALSLVPGRLLAEKLPSGPDHSSWHQLSNEIQMLFHGAAFNQKREAAGKLPVNTLWFWGAGELVRPLKSDYQYIVSDDPLAELFAKRTDTKIISVPESVDELFEIMPDGRTLLVLDKLLAYSQKNDYLGWARQLEKYEQHWFKPLTDNIKNKMIKSISILTSTGERFDYLSHHRWWFWRKEYDLQDWINR